MQIYRERFEDDGSSLSYEDLWAFLSNKIAHEGENVIGKAGLRPG